MNDTLLQWNLAALFPLFLLLLCTSSFAGNYLGHWFLRHPKVTAMRISDIVPTAILGLLGLLLGFTFSMAVTRFEVRRELIVQEVNAIDTAYLRTQLLTDQDAATSRQLLRTYVDERLHFLSLSHNDPELITLEKSMPRLHHGLWQLAMATSKTEKGPLTALYVSALNQLIDVYTASLMAMQNHVPTAVYLSILVAAFFGLFTLGYSQGLEQRLGYLGNFLLSLLFAIVIVLIMDVDRPRSGLIQVNEDSMYNLQQELRE